MSLYFSGIQPTGNLHLGNYLGALKNWVTLQENTDCLFCVVDMHAITIPQDPLVLRENIYKTAALYLACGIKKESVFEQSQVHEHAELAWILSCITPIGWMNRMTQFKDKVAKNKGNALVGLYTYPILMAADILLYKSTHVPVGDDQKQHVEIARDIAMAFNNKVEQEFFKLPEFVKGKIGTRIMSLKDATQKMSKSDDSEYSRINIVDDDDTIFGKIKKAKTDSCPIPSQETELEDRLEAKNLIAIMACLKGITVSDILSDYGGQNFSNFKKDLADALITELKPIRDRYNSLIKDKAALDEVLNVGLIKARGIAQQTMREIKFLIGWN